MNRPYQICTKSVMDTIADPDISFDENGICNYYYEYVSKAKHRLFHNQPDKLESILRNIKRAGQGKEYDCIIGVSGGVDSTYIAYLVKQWGLRPLAVHFDNGWNSELAVKNIENTLKNLNIELYTYVIDWEEFKSLQLGFLKSSTPDGEIPTDHAIIALLFKVANEKDIKYIINGNNFETESVMPVTWSYGHIDWKYIRTINRKFGASRQLKTYPFLTPLKYVFYTFIKQVKILSILNYVKYDKEIAMDLIGKELDWKYYGGKHYESVYTRFFQGYILMEKFQIDKRKAHLSALIFSGQLTREKALDELKKTAYSRELLSEDKTFVLKKFNLTENEFERIMAAERRTFKHYPNNYQLLTRLRTILNNLRAQKILYS